MAKETAKTAITPTREEDYPEWYQQVVKVADLAENSPVRGCMVIKPWGWALWENMQRILDRMFKDTGHVNAYFPLFIPLSYLEREAEHVEGFAKECAVVTHHRLEPGPKGGLVPAAPLDEPLIVRPTSETIIGETYARWVQSYRDLPILINQWANVVRWEMRPRVFLRTTEFLWQEGHTVHATAKEAMEETMRMLGVYADFAENSMAVPVVQGEKTPAERFPGAVATYTIEAMMQDRKALQAGTSHFLGQNFARASKIQYLSAEGKQELAWTTSWGVSTRLIGALIMTHSDDDGLVLPPKLAPKHVVLLPIYKTDEEKSAILEFAAKLAARLRDVDFADGKVQVELDARDIRPAEKTWQHVKKGVPIRVEIGPRDLQQGTVFVGRRDKGAKERENIPTDEFVGRVASILDDLQSSLYERAKRLRESNTKKIDTLADFVDYFTPANADKPEIHGGFALAHWADDPAVEEKLKDLKVTARCIPLAGDDEPGQCLFTGKLSQKRVLFAKAY